MDNNNIISTHPGDQLIEQITKVIVGKEKAIRILVTALFSGGHVLIEDVPGTGKTTLAMAMAKATSLSCRRVQFTPDVMASDITGFTMYNKGTDRFEYRKGLIMTNLFIADEINRTSPKTQSALLEAMEESKVTVDGQSHPLPSPFMVVATENELGYVGTYPLPEAQLDRFMLKLNVGYPTPENEMEILYSRRNKNPLDGVVPVCSGEDVLTCIEAVKNIHLDVALYKYIVAITTATRNHPMVALGASPRASLALMRLAQSEAFLSHRSYVTPEDVALMAPYALGHRIHLTQQAKVNHVSVTDIINEILSGIKPPYRKDKVNKE